MLLKLKGIVFDLVGKIKILIVRDLFILGRINILEYFKL